jgi:hypothetical protein
MAKVLKVRNADNTGWDEIASSIPDIPDISEFATIEYVDNEIENIDLSPYLTQSSASSTYATQSYVNNELSNIDLTETINTASAAAVTYLIDSAPSALNTLNELAAALGDDENFATTVTNSLSEKLSISSASTTYATKIELQNIDGSSDQFILPGQIFR